jgi:hypothetical protein
MRWPNRYALRERIAVASSTSSSVAAAIAIPESDL